VIRATDQRTTSGPADPILRAKDPMIEAQANRLRHPKSEDT
jgi:hypothetical protein